MNPNNIYNSICGFSPTPEQIGTFNALIKWETSKNPLLIRLPCGYGKMESVVIPFLSQAITNEWSLAPRLIYVLPTRALCNQIKNRIRCYALKLRKLTRKQLKVGIEHGTSSLDPLFFSDICVTTFDQFLYGYARTKRQVGRHFDLPAGAIANSLVVFDEAHLYSPYTHSLMRAMLEILITGRIPTIIMTATMPKSLEDDLVSSAKGKKVSTINFNGKWPSFMTNRSIKWHQEECGLLDGEDLSKELNNLLQSNKNKRILIIVNRIDTAQKLAKLLKGRSEFITLIHSRFTAENRKQKEADVCKYFGKNQNEQRAGIIVSTQVCEVGLDISCDILITECASADALVQRVGRVARWGGDGEVIIVRPMATEDWVKDDQWSEAFPYVDRKKDGVSKYAGIKNGEFAGITWEYLKQTASKNPFIDWNATTEFCNAMDYHTDDVEARGALGQLFESTLYADDRPWNLSARGDLYCTLAVVPMDFTVNAGVSGNVEKRATKTRKKKVLEVQIPYKELKKYFINVPFRYLVNKDTKKLKQYDFEEGKAGDELEKARVKPFQTYIVESSGYYDSDIGLTLAQKEKSNETEEASCLIL
jgi:CRISPR-associated endonuclease/helicase Cas3